MTRLTVESMNNPINKRCCVKCGKEVKVLAKGKCNTCYGREYTYQKHINSPMIKCECMIECKVMIHSIGKKGIPSRYALHHSPVGKNHQSWKGGRVKQREYWILWCPAHPNSNKIGYIPEHVYNFTQFNKCCMLPWGIVHHSDENKENNMPWNLEGMYRPNHGKHHNPLKDHFNTKCSICGSNETYKDKGIFPHWSKDDKGGFWCKKCSCKQYHKQKKLEQSKNNKSIIDYI